MKIKFSEIEDAFEFVGCAGHGEHTALLDKKEMLDVWYAYENAATQKTIRAS